MEFSYLDPATTRLEQAPDGLLRIVLESDRCGLRVEVFRAFPLSHPDEYIVLREGGGPEGSGQEYGVVRRLSELPREAAQLLHEQLRRRYFLPQVTAIHAITERFGSSVWDLETDRGRCSVTTRQMNEAVAEIEPGRYIITDVEANRFEIKNLTALDPDSTARFFGKY